MIRFILTITALLCMSIAAHALTPAQVGAVGSQVSGSGGGSDYLDSVLDSVVMDIDATIADSYTSGQTWANLIASPADGADQTDYDFYLGADGSGSTDDPTFTGSAGDAGAYFNFDGGDYFTASDGVGHTNTPVLRDIAKTTAGNEWWIAYTFKTAASLSNARQFGSADTVDDVGIHWNNTGGGDNLNAVQFTGGGAGTFTILYSDNNALSSQTDYILIVSVDMDSATDNVRYWLNSGTGTTSSKSITANASATDGVFRIGAADSQGTAAGSFVPSGQRVYSFAMGNEYLDDTKAAAIIAHLEARHSRDYTP